MLLLDTPQIDETSGAKSRTSSIEQPCTFHRNGLEKLNEPCSDFSELLPGLALPAGMLGLTEETLKRLSEPEFNARDTHKGFPHRADYTY